MLTEASAPVRRMIWALISCIPLVIAPGLMPNHAEATSAQGLTCQHETVDGNRYIICVVDLTKARIIMDHARADGSPYGGLQRFVRARREDGQLVYFAMNGGMYHRDLSPVGYYVEGGEVIQKASTSKGPGNFHMLPNGIFWLEGSVAGVTETHRFVRDEKPVDYATQSGPMLVIDGKLHPRFFAESDSRKIRNGVGTRKSGREAVFVISRDRVNFHTFASLFRDHLNCANALYLDGTISSIHAPSVDRSDGLFPVGPIIAVVSPGSEAARE